MDRVEGGDYCEMCGQDRPWPEEFKPTYTRDAYGNEWLAFDCPRCGYRWSKPCLGQYLKERHGL